MEGERDSLICVIFFAPRFEKSNSDQAAPPSESPSRPPGSSPFPENEPALGPRGGTEYKRGPWESRTRLGSVCNCQVVK